ncbi:hypothetical protein ACRYI5_01860 [Furfurilactobacillus sp. WILCCON 0119]|uniref:hypothetical protein n=1 Tax=Furfurilactobacillus entadae TaxID=2922307 RepID=UPI0035E83922
METEEHRNLITTKLRRLFTSKPAVKQDRAVLVPQTVRPENTRFDRSLANSLLSLQFARINN